MDVNDPVIKLCVEGSQLELNKDIEGSKKLYRKAWKIAEENYQKCISAHYMARNQTDIDKEFDWNNKALEYAKKSDQVKVNSFYGSLYLNLAHSYEKVNQPEKAKEYYAIAEKLGYSHSLGL